MLHLHSTIPKLKNCSSNSYYYYIEQILKVARVVLSTFQWPRAFSSYHQD